MALIRIAPPRFDLDIALAYATPSNVTGKPIYRPGSDCWLHTDAAERLAHAAALAKPLGLRLYIFDAFRPQAAQWALWNHTPDPEFVADPRRGSPHSRGVAVDLTLFDSQGRALDMGTPFDFFSPKSWTADPTISAEQHANRMLLATAMRRRGFHGYDKEWWHFTLRDEPFPETYFDFPVR